MGTNINKLVTQTLGVFTGMGLALFLPAGTIAWFAGWVYLVLFFCVFVGVNVWLIKHNPGLFEERLRLGTSDQKGWDKILFPLLSLFPLVWLIFIACDARRFHWSEMPIGGQLAGFLILLGAYYLIFIAFRENSFASPVVRIQEERGQTVISSGPYRFVRHPMYSGIVAFAVGTPLLLGSWYGILLGMVLVLILARRTILEERTLQGELPGYAEYTTRVKYRFIPYIW